MTRSRIRPTVKAALIAFAVGWVVGIVLPWWIVPVAIVVTLGLVVWTT